MTWEEILTDLVDTRGLAWVLGVLARVCEARGWGLACRTLGRLAHDAARGVPDVERG